MSNRKIDRVSQKKGRISWLLVSAVALPVVVLVMGLSAATAHAVLDEGPSTGTGLADASVVPPPEAPAVVAPGGLSPTATLPPPTATEEPPVPTPTIEPGAIIFTGTFSSGIPSDCGGGTFSLTLTPDKSGIVLLVVSGFVVAGSPNDNQTEFDPPVAIDPDVGTFFTEGPLPPPLEIVLSTFEGFFDFDEDPAIVTGILTIALVADPSTVLCEAVFFGEQLPAGAEPPTSAPPAATATVAPGLPDTGSSGGSSSDGALWAIVAGIVGLFALGTAGVASFRRRGV